MFQIHSDYDDGKGNIDYSLEGIGANQYPFHVFVVDPKTGHVCVTRVLDRELIDTYNVSDDRLFYSTVLFDFDANFSLLEIQ